MAILSILVFGAALSAAVWAIHATVAPEMARIVDLLKHGPMAAPELPRQVAVRSTLRSVTVRPIRSSAPMRAAA